MFQNLNVGYMLFRDEGPDLALIDWERRKNAKATRNGAQIFYPGKPSSFQVSIPSEWANFFTVLLMSPESFGWAKDFLSSKAVQHLQGNLGNIDFSLPKNYPSDKGLACFSDSSQLEKSISKSSMVLRELQEEMDHEESLVPALATPKKISKRKPPLVVLEVRSPRLENSNNGSKPSSCCEKICQPNPGMTA